MADVVFKYGTRAQYESIKGSALSNALYFLTDTGELYRGNVAIGQAHVYEVALQANETPSAALLREYASAPVTPVNGDFFIGTENGLKSVYIYNNNAWLLISHEAVVAENVIFEDGSSLDEVLENITVATDNITIEQNDDGKLAIKDYGVAYYRFVPAVPAVGEEGDPDYEPAVPASYVLQEVDTEHPWQAGLEFRSTTNGVGWYEQNSDTIDGLQGIVAALENRVEAAEQALESKAGVFHFKGVKTLEEGETIEESLAAIENPVDGDVYQYGDSEYVYTTEGEWVELGPNVDLSGYVTQTDFNTLKATVGSLGDGVSPSTGLFAYVDNKIGSLALFDGEKNGLVPVATVDSALKASYFLNANGVWVQPQDARIGTLTFNSVTYDTVEEYVNGVVDAALEWTPIV